jgi:hypothetical protein
MAIQKNFVQLPEFVINVHENDVELIEAVLIATLAKPPEVEGDVVV